MNSDIMLPVKTIYMYPATLSDDMGLGCFENATPQHLWHYMFNARPSTKWFPKFIIDISLHLYAELKTQYQSLLNLFENYCDQIVILGFDSQKYDVNLLKPYLLKCLGFGHG